MTPRQLRALAEQHSVYTGRTAARTAAPVGASADGGKGSAGWLLAVADQLNRQKAGRPTPAGA